MDDFYQDQDSDRIVRSVDNIQDIESFLTAKRPVAQMNIPLQSASDLTNILLSHASKK